MSFKDHLTLIEGVSNGTYKEAVDVDAARKKLTEKQKELSDAISNFENIDDDIEKILQAMPTGMKSFMKISRALSTATEGLNSMSAEMMNQQNWDSSKLTENNTSIDNHYSHCDEDWTEEDCDSFKSSKCPECGDVVDPYQSTEYTDEGDKEHYHE